MLCRAAVVLCRAAADYAVQCQDESCARGGLACVSLSEHKLDALASHNLGTARLGEAGRRLAAHSHTQPHTASHSSLTQHLSQLPHTAVSHSSRTQQPHTAPHTAVQSTTRSRIKPHTALSTHEGWALFHLRCSNNSGGSSGLDKLFVFELITLFVCPGACQTSLVGERLVRGWSEAGGWATARPTVIKFKMVPYPGKKLGS